MKDTSGAAFPQDKNLLKRLLIGDEVSPYSLTNCPNCKEDQRVWTVEYQGLYFGACFHCECMYAWEPKSLKRRPRSKT